MNRRRRASASDRSPLSHMRSMRPLLGDLEALDLVRPLDDALAQAEAHGEARRFAGVTIITAWVPPL